jgi:hypothetical protein
MLLFRVFAYPKPRSATHQSRPPLPAPSPCLPSLHSSLFFSEDCALFPATAVSQPFAYQSFLHSFYCDGGVGDPSNLSTFKRPPFRPRDKMSVTASLLDATLVGPLVSVGNKRLTGSLSSLVATLTRNRGVGGVLWLTNSLHAFRPTDVQTFRLRHLHPGPVETFRHCDVRTFRRSFIASRFRGAHNLSRAR